jgi:hypothetical protein
LQTNLRHAATKSTPGTDTAPGTDKWLKNLRQVPIQRRLIRVSLEIFSLDEVLDTLLNNLRLRLEEGELGEDLGSRVGFFGT